MLDKKLSIGRDYRATDLLDEKEAAKYLRLSPATLRNWRAARRGPAVVRVGKRAVRYRFGELEAFIVASTAELA